MDKDFGVSIGEFLSSNLIKGKIYTFITWRSISIYHNKSPSICLL